MALWLQQSEYTISHIETMYESAKNNGIFVWRRIITIDKCDYIERIDVNNDFEQMPLVNIKAHFGGVKLKKSRIKRQKRKKFDYKNAYPLFG